MAINPPVEQDKPPDPSQNYEQSHPHLIHEPQKQKPEKNKGISTSVDGIHITGDNHPLPATTTGPLGTNKSPATIIHQRPTSNIVASNGLLQISDEIHTGKNGAPVTSKGPNQRNTVTHPTVFPKVSANFDRPGSSIQSLQQRFNGIAPVRQNAPMNSQVENRMPPNVTQLKVSPPLPHSVKPTFANTLRSIHEQSVPRIELSPTKQTTKQGYPAVIFKRDDYLVKLAARCKFTLIGKFESTMPRMEVIRKSFEAQVQLKGTVKITHFNSNHVYIDLTNQLDHDMVWFKEKIWIQGRQMKLFVWTPTFKPNEETPIVPIWVVLPELPWHMYYLEAISELFLSVGRAISLDTATFQKTRGSVAKVKLEIDVTKSRPNYLWVGYDEDENGEGYWQEVQYEDVPDYCFHCKHQGHSINVCLVKKREDHMANNDFNDKDEVSGVQKNLSHKDPNLSVQHTTAHHTNVIDINVQHKKNNHRGKPPPPKQQYVAKDSINNNVRKEELGAGALGKPHALMEIQQPVVASCTTADATGTGNVTGNVQPAAANNVTQAQTQKSASVKHFPDVVQNEPAVVVDQQLNADSVKGDNGVGATQHDAGIETLETDKQGQKSVLSANALGSVPLHPKTNNERGPCAPNIVSSNAQNVNGHELREVGPCVNHVDETTAHENDTAKNIHARSTNSHNIPAKDDPKANTTPRWPHMVEVRLQGPEVVGKNAQVRSNAKASVDNVVVAMTQLNHDCLENKTAYTVPSQSDRLELEAERSVNGQICSKQNDEHDPQNSNTSMYVSPPHSSNELIPTHELELMFKLERLMKLHGSNLVTLDIAKKLTKQEHQIFLKIMRDSGYLCTSVAKGTEEQATPPKERPPQQPKQVQPARSSKSNSTRGK